MWKLCGSWLFLGKNAVGKWLKRLAAPQGFEPRYADPESAVLPLNEGATTKLFIKLHLSVKLVCRECDMLVRPNGLSWDCTSQSRQRCLPDRGLRIRGASLIRYGHESTAHSDSSAGLRRRCP